jgi:putative two-component system protein, hydrogenase maturation factor HypX/HoxX
MRSTVAVVDSAAAMEAAVSEHDPELIVCPFLKTFIPETIWRRRPCLVLHPGPRRDRGPSSLDWAIELGTAEWGVTALLANGDFDAGEVVATARPLMSQHVREIDWHTDPTDAIIRKVRAGEGHPGVLDVISGCAFHLFGVHRARNLEGSPGEIVAHRNGAVCRATADGAAWITHLRQRDTPTQCYFKLPATLALDLAGIELTAPVIDAAPDARLPAGDTYREITYGEHAGVGYLRFDFYNGAMSTDQCLRLQEAYAHARARRNTRVIVLLGGDDYFSNGIHLNLIEASEDPGAESWRNLNAINHLVRDIVETDSHLVISALGGDAAAGGVPLALAADYAVACEEVVLNPYYAHMGGLYGSEYWTYLLPRRSGVTITTRLTQPPFNPMGAREAVRIGVLDAAFGADLGEFRALTRRLAERVGNDGLHRARLEDKRRRRAHDERTKPLQAYRTEELAQCLECFFGRDRRYHDARRRFVYKLPAAESILRQAA